VGTTSGAVLRKLVAENLADYRSLTTTSAGAAGGTTIVDTGLAEYAEADGGFPGWWAFTTSGAATDEERRIKGSGGYTSSSTTLNPSVAFSAQIASGVTYELYKYRPTLYRDAVNRAIEELHPFLYLPIRDESLFVDSLLADGGFEGTVSGGAFPDWTNGGSPTVTAETSIVIHGKQSAKVVASGAAGQLIQTPNVNVFEMTGKRARFKAMAYATAADKVRIRIDWDGSAFENSSYHSGKDQFEPLTVEATIPSTATQVKCICEVVDGSTGYFDASWLAVGRKYRFTLPTDMITGPHFVEQQVNGNQPGQRFARLTDRPTAGRALLLRGMGYLSRPTTETGTTEVDGARVNLIIALATMRLARMLSNRGLEDAEIIYDRAERDYIRLLDQPGIKMAPMAAEIPKVWHTEADSAGRYLVFDA